MRSLKKCPFCGSDAVLRSGKDNPRNIYAPVYCAYIQCSACTANVSNFVSDCAEDLAIEAWNRRAVLAGMEGVTSPCPARPKLPPFNEALRSLPESIPGIIATDPYLRGAKDMYELMERQATLASVEAQNTPTNLPSDEIRPCINKKCEFNISDKPNINCANRLVLERAVCVNRMV